MYECDRCGESVFTPEKAREVDRLVKLTTHQHLSLLPPEKLYPSESDAASPRKKWKKLFGLGQKVVIRWEKGRVLQSKTADLLLRLLDRNPDIIEGTRQIQDLMISKETA